MHQLRNYGDERQLSACVFCRRETETRDHVPSRVLLDEPYPENLPVVPACRVRSSALFKINPPWRRGSSRLEPVPIRSPTRALLPGKQLHPAAGADPLYQGVAFLGLARVLPARGFQGGAVAAMQEDRLASRAQETMLCLTPEPSAGAHAVLHPGGCPQVAWSDTAASCRYRTATADRRPRLRTGRSAIPAASLPVP